MSRLTLADVVRTAWLGVAGRPQRTVLAALGIALGMASLAALTGAAASNRAQLLAGLDAMGADLAVVTPATGEPITIACGDVAAWDQAYPAFAMAYGDALIALGEWSQTMLRATWLHGGYMKPPPKKKGLPVSRQALVLFGSGGRI